MPWRLSKSMMCSITGLLTTGARGLGKREVSGRKREPSPPAITTALMGTPSKNTISHGLFLYHVFLGIDRAFGMKNGSQAGELRIGCDFIETQRQFSAPVRILVCGARYVHGRQFADRVV